MYVFLQIVFSVSKQMALVACNVSYFKDFQEHFYEQPIAVYSKYSLTIWLQMYQHMKIRKTL